MTRIKRVYDPVTDEDGYRILVERLWPRGISKETAHLDLWLKDVAPSTELRKWYRHDVQKWKEFQQKYLDELRHNNAIKELVDLIKKKKQVTFVYAARDDEHNSALLLKKFLDQ